MTRVGLEFDYDPHAPAPKRWLQYLNEAWPSQAERDEFIPALQRLMGALLVNDTSWQAIGLLIGPSGCGKGVALRVMTQLVGLANTAAVSARSLAKSEFVLSSLRGKTLATLSDMRLGPDIKEDLIERLLSISGEDMLGINRKHKSVLHEKLDTRIVIATNEIPNLPDAGGALCRRYKVIKFATPVARESMDARLGDVLTEELPAIFNWALEGLRAAWRDGLRNGPLASAELSVIHEVGSPLSAFVADCLTVEAGAMATRADIYRSYTIWALGEGNKSPLSDRVFGRRLRDTLPSLGDSRPRVDGVCVRHYTGVKLQT